ncbi:MAG: Flp pilus assembly complex ATPase component TadA [Polyangiaceae bacterium]|nr:Flp pilus assembly complex ATPase component TadA [Polyangiaceae bacterium]
MISPTQSSRSLFAIVISEKGGAERREVFERPEVSVGRVQGNDLMLPKGNVSKRHARLIFRDSRFIVTDLNSTNGTYVNRRRISQATIVREGDRIYIGDFVLRIEMPEGQSEPSTGGEQTGSGPVPAAVRAAASDSGATAFPEQELEEASGVSYPEVPGPPRMPSAPRPEAPSEAHPSEKMPLASVVDVSHADIDLRQMVQSGEETKSHRSALTSLVGRVVGELDAALLDGIIDESTRGRIERSIEERAHELKSQGELPADVDVGRLSQEARAELFELGAIGPLLVDSSVSEIVATRFDAISAVKAGRHVPVTPGFSSEEALRRVVRRLCRAAGMALGADETSVERQLRDGSRLWAAVGAAAPAGLLVIQKPRRIGASFEELVRSGTISRAIATFLGQCVAARLNVLVAGPRDAGTSAVVAALAAAQGDSRQVVLFDLDDVSPSTEGVTRLALGPGDEAARALGIAAHVPGARLVVEVANRALAAALVDVVGDGVSGVVASVHATSVRRALARFAADVSAARPAAGIAAAREWVASTFDVVVEVGRLRDSRLRVLRVAELAGVSADEIKLSDIFSFTVERTAAGGAVEGTFNAAGSVPKVADEISGRGFQLESSLFTRPPSR